MEDACRFISNPVLDLFYYSGHKLKAAGILELLGEYFIISSGVFSLKIEIKVSSLCECAKSEDRQLAGCALLP